MIEDRIYDWIVADCKKRGGTGRRWTRIFSEGLGIWDTDSNEYREALAAVKRLRDSGRVWFHDLPDFGFVYVVPYELAKPSETDKVIR